MGNIFATIKQNYLNFINFINLLIVHPAKKWKVRITYKFYKA